MANPFFSNTIDLLPATKARAGDVEANLTAVEAGFDEAKQYFDRTLRGARANPAIAELPNAATRANKALTFDGSGNPVATVTTTEISNAQTYANNAQASATAASGSAGAAAGSAASAASLLDAFDDRYLGSKASDPTLDNDGNALLTGALYWNTTSSTMRVWSGTAWVTAYVTTAATGISNTPAGNIAATNVQAAINELDTEKVAKAGDTMTGNLTVPSLNTGQLAGLRNKIINGKMEVAQRGTSFAAIATGAYSVDRWQMAYVTSAVITASQSTDVPSSNEFQNSLRHEVTTANASLAATDVLYVQQLVEGYNARDLIGRDVTVSFWVRSSKTGVHCVSLSNDIQDRSYIAEYTINVANTWEKKTATFVGGLITAGTWNWTNGKGVRVRFALAAGTNFQGAAGSWLPSAAVATSSQVNCLDTIGNIFAITGVQLEVGSVATPFEHRPYGMELALCQRYYYRETPTAADQTLGVGHNTLTTAAVATSTFPVQMRSSPTALEQSGTAGDYSVAHANTNTACSAVPTFLTASPFAATTTLTVAAGLTAGQGSRARAVNTSAYLAWSAEL